MSMLISKILISSPTNDLMKKGKPIGAGLIYASNIIAGFSN